MTAMRPALELIIDANIVLLFAFGLWKIVHLIAERGRLRHNYPAQLRLLKSAFAITMASPLLAFLAASGWTYLWPQSPITASDIAVAIYLKGDIALPAAEFEALLNTRARVLDALFGGSAPWLTIALAAFVAGALIQAGRVATSFVRIRSVLNDSYVWRRTARVDIRLSDTVGIPFAVRGLFRRHVVLPSRLVTKPRQMRYVLAHECQHCRDGDVEWELFLECLRPLMYWNPAFVFWKRSFDKLRELGCDQSVIARRGIPSRDYSDCLLDFCQRQFCDPWPRAMHVALLRTGRRTAKRDLELRILALHGTPNSERRIAALPALILVLAVGVSMAAASVRQPGDWSHDRIMLSTIVNLERLEAINRGF